jgi:hypothetical protein
MSTRSRIGIIRERPALAAPLVESIYCHFDGYPEGVGQTLIDHWTTTEKVLDLIELGDLSSLGSEIGEDQGTDWFDKAWGVLHPEGEEWNDPRLAWCIAYTRDRGEEDCGSRTHSIDDWPDYGQEAEYVFDPETGEWRVRRQDFNPVGWNTVTPWEGWIPIPEAIALELQAEGRLG